MDGKAAFLLRLASGRILREFHMIDFAADDAPVAGFRRLQASAKEDLSIPQDCQTAAETGEIDTGQCHERESGLADDQHEGRNVVAETNRRRAVVMIAAVALATVAIVVIGCILRAAGTVAAAVMTILAVGIAFDLHRVDPFRTVSSSSVLLPEAVTGLRSA